MILVSEALVLESVAVKWGVSLHSFSISTQQKDVVRAMRGLHGPLGKDIADAMTNRSLQQTSARCAGGSAEVKRSGRFNPTQSSTTSVRINPARSALADSASRVPTGARTTHSATARSPVGCLLNRKAN